MTRRILAVFSMWGALLLLSGCAAMRQQAIYEEARDFIYPLPLEQVWPQVERFVNAEGFPARNDPEHFVIVTDWRNDFKDSRVASASSRLFVAGFRLNRGNCVVRIFRHTLMTGSKGEVTAKSNVVAQGLQPFTAEDVAYEDVLAQANPRNAIVPLMRPMVQLNRIFSRDLALEWELLQKLAPEQAEQVVAHVDAR